MSASELLRTAFTLAIALCGGALFHVANLPVAWLSGSMLAVALLVMFEGPAHMPRLLRDFGLLTAGISLGSAVTPEAIDAVQRYPLSLLGLAVTVLATVSTSTWLLRRWFGWDAPTAYLSSVPGALSAVMALALDSSGDTRRIAVVQAIRLFTMVMIVPTVIRATNVQGAILHHATVTLPGLALTYAVGIAVAAVFKRLRMASPLFLAGMMAGTGLHLANIVPGQVPPAVLVLGMVLIGMFAGMRFAGIRLRDLAEMILPGLVVLVVAVAFGIAGAMMVAATTGIRVAEVLVAFAPGGAEAMIMMGAAMGLDALYISTHHILRAVGLNLIAPFFMPADQSAKPPSTR